MEVVPGRRSTALYDSTAKRQSREAPPAPPNPLSPPAITRDLTPSPIPSLDPRPNQALHSIPPPFRNGENKVLKIEPFASLRSAARPRPEGFVG